MMKVQVENIDSVKKKVEVVLPEEKINSIRESIYSELQKQAKIKGFRPGKVPRPMIMSYYKDYIDDELKKRMVQETMYEALDEAKVNPVVQPVVDFINEADRQGYVLECEVIPDIELPAYKGIEVEVEPIEVSDEEVAKRLDGLQHMHAEIVAIEGGRGAQNGDLVIIKYQGYEDGKPVKGIETEAYPVELGSSTLMPEFENALIGMKESEEKEIPISFPDDYPDKDIAKKTLQFKVTMKDIKEKRLPEVNDEFAKDLNFDNIEAMHKGLRDEIAKEKENVRSKEVAQKVMDALIGAVDIPVPKILLEKRIEMMMEEAKSRFKADRLTEEEARAIEERFRKDFEKSAETRIKSEILIAKISEKEGISADENDVQERIKKIAEDAKRPLNDVRNFYEQYNLLNNLRSSIIEERTISFLRDNALIKERS
ncbi:MAG TPA: trigger factor [Syntrophorhabdaceae bacterium]|nr:trigger factor [Syntrophorhabdaceae bacterium]HNT68496.1 trigger factor [Syntrophorhabdaceae bacterium]